MPEVMKNLACVQVLTSRVARPENCEEPILKRVVRLFWHRGEATRVCSQWGSAVCTLDERVPNARTRLYQTFSTTTPSKRNCKQILPFRTAATVLELDPNSPPTAPWQPTNFIRRPITQDYQYAKGYGFTYTSPVSHPIHCFFMLRRSPLQQQICFSQLDLMA